MAVYPIFKCAAEKKCKVCLSRLAHAKKHGHKGAPKD